MTYTQDESSRESGIPIELYEFRGQGATALAIWRYTSAQEDYIFGADLYAAIPMERSVVEMGPDGTAPELSVTLPINLDLVSKYVFQIAPQGLELTVRRVHKATGNSIVYWAGPITSWTVKEYLVRLRCPTPLSQLMDKEIPTIRYQPYCNNVLFDEVCALVASSYSETGSITTISGDGKTLTLASAGLGVQPDNWAKGGEIVNQANGERRMILSQIGTTINILWPFSVNTTVGASIDVFAGCDHSISVCVNKFSNYDRFNGMPNVTTQETLQPRRGR